MTRLSDILPKGDDKERAPLSKGMELKIINARVIHSKKWNTAQIDTISPKGKEINLYTTSAVITEQIDKLIAAHKPTQEDPITCIVCEYLSETANQNYLILE